MPPGPFDRLRGKRGARGFTLSPRGRVLGQARASWGCGSSPTSRPLPAVLTWPNNHPPACLPAAPARPVVLEGHVLDRWRLPLAAATGASRGLAPAPPLAATFCFFLFIISSSCWFLEGFVAVSSSPRFLRYAHSKSGAFWCSDVLLEVWGGYDAL